MPPRAPSAPSAYRRADQQAEDGAGPANRLGGTDRLCETLSSWRLLVGGLSPGASHHSFTTSSEEPTLSNFNSYRDISPFSTLGEAVLSMVVSINAKSGSSENFGNARSNIA